MQARTWMDVQTAAGRQAALMGHVRKAAEWIILVG